ncbi:unnamed protein product [Strongylus vulgaris]|uniref:Uncharacterized protein n=1 Tax=Strongylus vulgaris TaxID=40348 RepID=A0A3P7JBH2_STRVU|nr:unnamed protein product [Strongylus vulgaris]
MSNADEQQLPVPAKTRIQLPPLQAPKHRVSSSWTENLEPSMDIKSPPPIKSPEEKPGPSKAFFSRASSEVKPFSEDEVTSPKPAPSPLSDSMKEDSKEEKPEKRGRRDSIKEHLLKFKMKAGKVLEDVHDRLVEDHSSVAVAPMSVSWQYSDSKKVTNMTTSKGLLPILD